MNGSPKPTENILETHGCILCNSLIKLTLVPNGPRGGSRSNRFLPCKTMKSVKKNAREILNMHQGGWAQIRCNRYKNLQTIPGADILTLPVQLQLQCQIHPIDLKTRVHQ